MCMKRKLLLLFLALAVFATLVFAITPFQTLVRECYGICTQVKKTMAEGCHTEFDECRASCDADYETCKTETIALNQACKAGCETNRTPACLLTCRQQFSFTKLCEEDACKKECSQARRECLYFKQQGYKFCRGACPYYVQNITCGELQVGQTYLDGCDLCRCNPTGEVTCSKTINCNFDNFSISEEECPVGNLFQPVCKGNYFRLRCTRDPYCICYDSCPGNSTCIKDFTVKVKSELDGYIGLQGEPLGDIGICGKKPNLFFCGNGHCDDGCFGDDCRYAESVFTCPEDCL